MTDNASKIETYKRAMANTKMCLTKMYSDMGDWKSGRFADMKNCEDSMEDRFMRLSMSHL